MNPSAKSSKRGFPNTNPEQQGSPSNLSDKRAPNASIIKKNQLSINYTSMWKAIQKIANPISFEALKQFYKIEP